MRRLGAAVAAAALLATTACAGDAARGGEPATRRQLFVVAGGDKVSGPDRVEARTGDTVELVVTSDAADELHVHGYDRGAELAAGRPATLSVDTDIPGVFEVELHRSGLVLTQLRVRP